MSQLSNPKTGAPLRRWVRFHDLRAAGIADSRTQLGRLIKNVGFPRGKLLGPKIVAWDAAEIEAWIDAQPLAVGRLRDHKNATAAEAQP
jgi:predicted DNA-binding transcriptional regulator AlpA